MCSSAEAAWTDCSVSPCFAGKNNCVCIFQSCLKTFGSRVNLVTAHVRAVPVSKYTRLQYAQSLRLERGTLQRIIMEGICLQISLLSLPLPSPAPAGYFADLLFACNSFKSETKRHNT